MSNTFAIISPGMVGLQLSAAARAFPGRSSRRASRAVRVSAGQDSKSVTSTNDATTSGTIFYGGKTYTDEQWAQALRDGSAQRNRDETRGFFSSPSLTDAMAFAGPAPEIVNGRLAMLGFVAAMAAEIRTDETVVKQWAQEPTLILLTFILFAAGSLVPIVSGKKESLGPFTPEAEMINGRAAMIGFASLLVAELVRGTALF